MRAAHHKTRRGKPSICPSADDLAAMAATMTTNEIAVKFGVAQSTARNWLADHDLVALQPNRMDRGQNQDEMYRRFKNDLDSIREFIGTRTILQIQAELKVGNAAVYRWERKYGVRALRVCQDCKTVLPFEQMVVRKDGRAISRCHPCQDKCTGKYVPIRQRIPEAARGWNSIRMSSADGINGWLRCHMLDLAA